MVIFTASSYNKKKMILRVTSFLTLCFMALVALGKADDANTLVSQRQRMYPVLKHKAFNNVLQLKVSRGDTLQEMVVEEIVVSLRGTTSIKDIESVAIYYNQKDSSDIGSTSTLFAKTEKVAPVVRLRGNANLIGKNCFFWLSYTLKDGANILNRVCGVCQRVVTNKGNATLIPLKNPKQLRMGVALRKHGDDNVDTYRIPGLTVTNKGSLIAVYDARRGSSRDLQGDIDIGLSRSTDGGNSWEPMRIALDMGEWGGLPQKFNGVSDACVLVDTTSGNIFVAGLWMHGVLNKDGQWIKDLTQESKNWNHQWRDRGSQPGFDVKETSQFLIARSTDDGESWEAPVNLTQMCKKREWWLWCPAPGNGITMADGTLVMPTQGRDENGGTFSNITYSKDGGKTWKTSNPAYTNTTECSIVQLNGGELMLNMRDNRNSSNKGNTNGRAIATTSDMGETWAEHPTSHGALIESVCMASLYKYGSVLLFSNPNTKNGRHHMTIKASLDNGNSWSEEHWLLLDEGDSFGYSCITKVDEDNIGILYEGSQADMVFQKIPIKDLLKPAAK